MVFKHLIVIFQTKMLKREHLFLTLEKQICIVPFFEIVVSNCSHLQAISCLFQLVWWGTSQTENKNLIRNKVILIKENCLPDSKLANLAFVFRR